jgi:hypothetical protein
MQMLADVLDHMDEADFKKLIDRLPSIVRDLEALRCDINNSRADVSMQVTALEDRISDVSDRVEQCNRD